MAATDRNRRRSLLCRLRPGHRECRSQRHCRQQPMFPSHVLLPDVPNEVTVVTAHDHLNSELTSPLLRSPQCGLPDHQREDRDHRREGRPAEPEPDPEKPMVARRQRRGLRAPRRRRDRANATGSRRPAASTGRPARRAASEVTIHGSQSEKPMALASSRAGQRLHHHRAGGEDAHPRAPRCAPWRRSSRGRACGAPSA